MKIKINYIAFFIAFVFFSIAIFSNLYIIYFRIKTLKIEKKSPYLYQAKYQLSLVDKYYFKYRPSLIVESNDNIDEVYYIDKNNKKHIPKKKGNTYIWNQIDMFFENNVICIKTNQLNRVFVASLYFFHSYKTGNIMIFYCLSFLFFILWLIFRKRENKINARLDKGLINR